MPSNFFERIKSFNDMYRMPATSGDPAGMLNRLGQFVSMLQDEFNEHVEVEQHLREFDTEAARVALADWLGDMIVYCASEAKRWGIPIEGVLDVIMDSNESKLDADGQPIFVNGKLQKGPGYWKPEPRIKQLLENHHG